MPPDDLFDDLDPGDNVAKPPAAPANPSAPAPNIEAALAQITQQVSEALRGVTLRLDRMEKSIVQPPADRTPAPRAGDSDVLTELVNDPDKFFESRIGGVVSSQLNQLVPFLETVADSATSSAKDRVREAIDKDMGTGSFDKLVGEDLDKALALMPAASRAQSNNVQALVAGILGGKVMSEDGRKQLSETVRSARAVRAQAPVLLTGNGRARAPRDTITDDEREAIASLQRSGIDFSEKAFLDAKSRGNTEEDWGSDWAKVERYWEEGGDKPVPPADAPAKPAEGAV